MEPAPLFEQLKQLVADGEPCALATVIAGPGDIGAKLLIRADGSIAGGAPEPLRAAMAAAARRRLERAESGIVRAGEAEVFVDVVMPPPTLVIFGGVHTAIPLSLFAHTLGFRVVVVDGRARFADAARFPHADKVIHAWPEDAIPQLRFDAATYVAVLTHDPKFDLPALKRLVYTNARYIGAIGSKATRLEHFAQLQGEGVPAELLRRVYGPIGLDVGAVTPEEVALAIMAEIVAVRYGRDGAPLSLKEGGSRAASATA
ncbi:MAG: XdhC family protein [Chloroflexi bacterium]|nr:XdhC family protein [Chloroflexota bacterium]